LQASTKTSNRQPSQKKAKKNLIYDVLYGFVPLSPVEWEVIHTPFYQRLRWIKQLGFTCYTFPGAEHSRFGHSIGVMHNAHSILNTIGKGCDEEALFSGNLSSSETKFHQKIRLAALLHDIGTFPFSHTTEMAYIRYAETKNNKKNNKDHPDDHEHLGSFIIKRTNGEGGITTILKKYGINPQEISDLVKGIGDDPLANQILHSEVDCDRMDYLLRDAHYTGLHYGTYDRDYLLHHFKAVKVSKHEILAINEKALYCIQDFLMSRFAWYSQVIRSARGAKFDALAEEICYQLLVDGDLYRYQELLVHIEHDPQLFYSFNDQYFMTTLHQLYHSGRLDNRKRLKEMAHHLLFAKSPKTIKIDEFKQRILEQDNTAMNEKIVKKAKTKLKQMTDYLAKNGSAEDWILDDLPRKNVVLVKSEKKVIKEKAFDNILFERDPAKIVREDGNVVLLSAFEDSLINKLQNSYNFLPNVFCSESAYTRLEKAGFLS